MEVPLSSKQFGQLFCLYHFIKPGPWSGWQYINLLNGLCKNINLFYKIHVVFLFLWIKTNVWKKSRSPSYRNMLKDICHFEMLLTFWCYRKAIRFYLLTFRRNMAETLQIRSSNLSLTLQNLHLIDCCLYFKGALVYLAKVILKSKLFFIMHGKQTFQFSFECIKKIADWCHLVEMPLQKKKHLKTNEIVNMNVSYKELPLTDKW